MIAGVIFRSTDAMEDTSQDESNSNTSILFKKYVSIFWNTTEGLEFESS